MSLDQTVDIFERDTRKEVSHEFSFRLQPDQGAHDDHPKKNGGGDYMNNEDVKPQRAEMTQ